MKPKKGNPSLGGKEGEVISKLDCKNKNKTKHKKILFLPSRLSKKRLLNKLEHRGAPPHSLSVSFSQTPLLPAIKQQIRRPRLVR